MAVSNNLLRLVKNYAMVRRFGLGPNAGLFSDFSKYWLKLAGCSQVDCVVEDNPCSTDQYLICNLTSSGLSNSTVDSQNTKIEITMSGGTAPYTYVWAYSGIFESPSVEEYPGNTTTPAHLIVMRKHTFDSSMGAGIPVSFSVKVTDANGCAATYNLSYTYTHA